VSLKDALGIDEAELVRLSRIGTRVISGTPTFPFGTTPRRMRVGRGLEFFELRPHVPGEDDSRIDWRATARYGRRVVRCFQQDALSTAWVCLDRSASMHTADGRKWKLAKQVATAFGHLMTSAGMRVGLVAFSESLDVVVAPARERLGFARLLRELAPMAPRTAGGASRLEACREAIRAHSTAIVVSDFLAPDHLRAAMDALVARKVRLHAIRVLDADELSVPVDRGPVVVVDAESGARRRIEMSANARELATRALFELEASLRAYCAERGVPLTGCTSDRSWRDVVGEHLLSLAR
jgi:uncharacterized protein (DUF58 family)